MAARCATGAFSTTCAVHIEDCEGWWLSGCCGSVAEHWRLKPERLPATAGFFTFLYFRLITSKFIYFQREARCSEHLQLTSQSSPSRLSQASRCSFSLVSSLQTETGDKAEGTLGCLETGDKAEGTPGCLREGDDGEVSCSGTCVAESPSDRLGGDHSIVTCNLGQEIQFWELMGGSNLAQVPLINFEFIQFIAIPGMKPLSCPYFVTTKCCQEQFLGK